MNSEAAQLLTAGQVAERWQTSKAQVYALARQGQLPFVALGRFRRFRVEAVEAFEAAGGSVEDSIPLAPF